MGVSPFKRDMFSQRLFAVLILHVDIANLRLDRSASDRLDSGANMYIGMYL